MATMGPNQGLYNKFRVERTDGSSAPGGKHERCRYFVLDLDHDEYADAALAAYAANCREKFSTLADDLERLAPAAVIVRDHLGRRLRELEEERDALERRVEELEAGLSRTGRDPVSRTRTCEHCGQQTRITTAGCDHCDVEDK